MFAVIDAAFLSRGSATRAVTVRSIVETPAADAAFGTATASVRHAADRKPLAFRCASSVTLVQ